MTVANAEIVADALAGIGHNNPPPPKYSPATTDAETIKASLTKTLAAIEGQSRGLDSKGLPFVISCADYLMSGSGSWVQSHSEWNVETMGTLPGSFPAYHPAPVEGTTQERKEAVEKFLTENGLKPGATNSAYTRTVVGAAVKLALMVTDPRYPVLLGWKVASPAKDPKTGHHANPYQAEKPADGVKAERCLIAEYRAIVPMIRNGKDFVPNTGTELMSVTFAKGSEIYARLVKGQRGTKAKTTTAVADGAIGAVKGFGIGPVTQAMIDQFASKDFVPKVIELVVPLTLAQNIVSKVNNRYSDDFPAEIMFALVSLKNEIEERIQTMPDGMTYRTIPSSGIGEGTLTTYDKIVDRAREAA